MAGVNQKLKASTLIESLIAMIIIVMSLVTATMIQTNVLASDKQRLKLKAMLILNTETEQTKVERNFFDSEKPIGEWIIKKTVIHYNQIENLYRLTLSIKDKDGKIIASRSELIIDP